MDGSLEMDGHGGQIPKMDATMRGRFLEEGREGGIWSGGEFAAKRWRETS